MTAGSIATGRGRRPSTCTGPGRPGTSTPASAVIRARNEARNLPWVLPPLLSVVDRLVIVDDLSDDETPGVARRCVEEAGAGARLDIQPYPFEVSRCGEEHLHTPGDSVHSLTHFYNGAYS